MAIDYDTPDEQWPQKARGGFMRNYHGQAVVTHPDGGTAIANSTNVSFAPVLQALLDAAKANDHVAYELINGWSTSAAAASPSPSHITGLPLSPSTR